ncbi:MAG: hypothetical protein PHE68_05855 [Candidatus Peribacteraceae bacterium]|nr:hypothetical protein [Candidatus Peribacteraceae bacterium]MDD5075021.1 hypothetical protein [Candidatus Peribacteraceae bacterium]
MPMLSEMLTWPNARHWFRLTEEGSGTRGAFGIIKGDDEAHTQVIPVEFPQGITVDDVLDAWKKQGGNWLDLVTPQQMGTTFLVVRYIDLGEYRVMWYVLHINNYPQDSCVVLRKPPV